MFYPLLLAVAVALDPKVQEIGADGVLREARQVRTDVAEFAPLVPDRVVREPELHELALPPPTPPSPRDVLLHKALFASLAGLGAWLVPVKAVHAIAGIRTGSAKVVVVPAEGLPYVHALAACAQALTQLVFCLAVVAAEPWVLLSAFAAAAANSLIHQRYASPWARGAKAAVCASGAIAALAASLLCVIGVLNPEVDAWAGAKPHRTATALQAQLLPACSGVLQLVLLAALCGLQASLTSLSDLRPDGRHQARAPATLVGAALGLLLGALHLKRSHVALGLDLALATGLWVLASAAACLPPAAGRGDALVPPPAGVQGAGLLVQLCFALYLQHEVVAGRLGPLLVALLGAAVLPARQPAMRVLLALLCPIASVVALVGTMAQLPLVSAASGAFALASGCALSAQAQEQSTMAPWLGAAAGQVQALGLLVPLLPAVSPEVPVAVCTCLGVGAIALCDQERRATKFR